MKWRKNRTRQQAPTSSEYSTVNVEYHPPNTTSLPEVEYSEDILTHVVRNAFRDRNKHAAELRPYEPGSESSSGSLTTDEINGLRAIAQGTLERRRLHRTPWKNASRDFLRSLKVMDGFSKGWLEGNVADPTKNITSRYRRDENSKVNVEAGIGGWYVPIRNNETIAALFPDLPYRTDESTVVELALCRPFMRTKHNVMDKPAGSNGVGLKQIDCMARVKIDGRKVYEVAEPTEFREDDCTRNQVLALEEVAALELASVEDLNHRGLPNYSF